MDRRLTLRLAQFMISSGSYGIFSSHGLVTCKDSKAPSFLHNFQYTTSLNDPTTSREAGFSWNGAIRNFWLISSPTMFDMRLISLLLNKLLHILIIVALISTEMLFTIGPLDHDMDDQVFHRPFVMFIGPGNVDG